MERNAQQIIIKKKLRLLFKTRRQDFLIHNKSLLTDDFYVKNYCHQIERLIKNIISQKQVRFSQDVQVATNKSLINNRIVIGGYWPLAMELNLVPILRYFNDKLFNICLPIVVAPGQPLIFRKWSPGDQLIQQGKLKVFEPKDDQELLIPDVLLVPLVAFNNKCHRLGYGGGFYDRTIHKLRITEKREILKIGMAFEAQKIQIDNSFTDEEKALLSEFQTEETDEQLDYILTETQLYSNKNIKSIEDSEYLSF
ncbi:5-formyltetrahydrofolate cyclo-ligase [Stylonychia lemnae]|uniref:5-formyltetrahydrofolate cyclo-ligase n=1 Tax=Stylonychia lemnae TaxID=5949 RepID=A0A078AGS4_STYLE|nr:5-formyltetrahydrofolate cyclo-ligase [Stylonychia lemnae]|eukprot:CDW81485.1 5-formyltetrahydrofolate cyclo-ligase [Stylonychia lemnae]